MVQGSNPTFRWTVDDKPYFTYYNTVLNVIYQHAALYKLTVSPSGPALCNSSVCVSEHEK